MWKRRRRRCLLLPLLRRTERGEEFGGEDRGAACVVVDSCRRLDMPAHERNEVPREEAGDPAVLAVVRPGHGVVQRGHGC